MHPVVVLIICPTSQHLTCASNSKVPGIHFQERERKRQKTQQYTFFFIISVTLQSTGKHSCTSHLHTHWHSHGDLPTVERRKAHGHTLVLATPHVVSHCHTLRQLQTLPQYVTHVHKAGPGRDVHDILALNVPAGPLEKELAHLLLPTVIQ